MRRITLTERPETTPLFDAVDRYRYERGLRVLTAAVEELLLDALGVEYGKKRDRNRRRPRQVGGADRG